MQGLTEHIDPFRCRMLYQKVLLRALIDALKPRPDSYDKFNEWRRDASQAQAWIEGKCQDFQAVCNYAGLDPDFVHDAYTSGRISYDIISVAEKQRRSKGNAVNAKTVKDGIRAASPEHCGG